MKQNYLFFALLIFFGLFNKVYAQTSTKNTDWLAIYHTQKIIGKWGYTTDIQYRSDNQFSNISAYLIRPGVSYAVNNNQTAGAGYAFLGNYDDANIKRIFYAENRIFEEYNLSSTIGKTLLAQRLRLEQRFVNHAGAGFSQRLRYYINNKIPLVKTVSGFDKGIYLTVQDEVFVNIENKQNASNSFFDQNRAYAAFGYRINSKIDLELGYQNQYIQNSGSNTSNNTVQIALFTHF